MDMTELYQGGDEIIVPPAIAAASAIQYLVQEQSEAMQQVIFSVLFSCVN
jgi:hypothetical protein